MEKVKEPKQKKIAKAKKAKKRVKAIHLKSVSQKIIVTFAIALVLMTISMVVFVAKASQFNNQYAAVLQNLTKINFIKTEVGAQPNRFMSTCMQQKNIEESGEKKILEDMVTYVAEMQEIIGAETAYPANQGAINTLQMYMEQYQEAAMTLINSGDGVHFPNLDTTVSEQIYGLYDYNTTVSNAATNLMTVELKRSGDVEAKIASNFRLMLITCSIIFVFAIIISIVLCIIVTRSITGPVKKLKEEIMKVADGDLSRDQIVVNSEDEIRDAADAFNVMTTSLKEIMHQVNDVAEELQNSSKVLERGIRENEEGAEGVAASLEQMTNLMEAQNAESDNTMKQVQEMNEVADRIQAGIEQINENAMSSTTQASDGSERILEYTKQLEEVNAVMSKAADVSKRLTDSTKEMNEILKSITDISSQTRLLSLNASIEAARAGEAGRGFAVVATEIGNLANDTQRATGKITEIVQTVQDDVKDLAVRMRNGLDQLAKSNEMADETKESFNQIASGTSMVSASIQEITSEMQVLADLVNAVVDSMDAMDNSIAKNKNFTVDIAATVTEQNANLDEIGVTASALADQAIDLKEMLSKFTLKEAEEATDEEAVPVEEADGVEEAEAEDTVATEEV